MSEMNNKFLFYFSKKYLNEGIIKSNIEKIANKLKTINISTDRHKYLSLSCIFGAFLADSIGSNCEFSNPSNKNHELIFKPIEGRFLPGEITDDSEMAMCSAFAYMDAKDVNDIRIQDLIYYYFCVWKASRPKDIGYATANSLNQWNQNCTIEQTKYDKIRLTILSQNWNSLSNGCLMRISTFIVFYYYSHYEFINETIQNYFNSNSNPNELTSDLIMLYSDIYNESIKNTQITHPNFENAITCSVFILMVLTGMIRRNANDIYTLFKIITISKKFINFHQGFINYAQSAQSKFATMVREVESKAKLTVFESMGYYVHAFKLCVYFIYRFPKMGANNTNYKNLYYDIMCDICDLGGDTDTNCAIVGTLIGPLLGYDNFKKELFDYFLRYIPENRTQYTSAFMYIYVDYLEKKYLYKNINTNGENYVAFKKITEFLTQQMNIA